MAATPHPASFRDPAGHVFVRDGVVYRQVNPVYREHFECLFSSGLYQELTETGKLIPHEVVDIPGTDDHAWKVLKPSQVDFFSYPYEWSFSQLRDAALLTLDIQARSMKKGMSLNDATPFNVTFSKGKPVFIDTLSFEKYTPEDPWIAYHQFCTGFLAPLLLASYKSPDLIRLLAVHPEGIPLSLCSDLLPWSSKLKPLSALHIHLQGGMKSRTGQERQAAFSAEKLSRIISHLQDGIGSLTVRGTSSWSDYYQETILSEAYLEEKKRLVADMLSAIAPQHIFDAGCNMGEFSLLMAEKGKKVIAADLDERCIDRLYGLSNSKGFDLDALIVDLMNPSPAIGWANAERPSLLSRIHVDLTMALALVHHLCLGKNLPFNHIASLFTHFSEWLLIEFVPVTDPKSKQLIQHKRDIYGWYTEEEFLKAFGAYYDLTLSRPVGDTGRTLHLFRAHKPSA
jgi:ribosomal protein L11 methylase PrmA